MLGINIMLWHAILCDDEQQRIMTSGQGWYFMHDIVTEVGIEMEEQWLQKDLATS